MNGKFRKAAALLVCLSMVLGLSGVAFAVDGYTPPEGQYGITSAGNNQGLDTQWELQDDENTLAAFNELAREWKMDQTFTLADPAPWNLDELQLCVDVTDPRSVAAYFVWAVNRLVDNYEEGMEMMKYLFADIEPYGDGFTEGGMSGRAGWDTYFNERLSSLDYFWLPRTYLSEATKRDGFEVHRPVKVDLFYNEPNTRALNSQSYEQMGRLNIVYWIQSNAGQNQVNINLSKFRDSDRWYVTSGTSSTAMFYDQRSALEEDELALAKSVFGDNSTLEEHRAEYGTQFGDDDPTGAGTTSGQDPTQGEIAYIDFNDPTNWGTYDKDAEDCKWSNTEIPFEDVQDDAYYRSSVAWARENGVTDGTSKNKFSPDKTCTRGQVVTFLWRAAGEPEPYISENPFTDVKPDDFFYKPALWAYEQHITQYASEKNRTFAPYQTCSSMHIATFLFRSVNYGADGWGDTARNWAISNGFTEDTDLEVKIGEDCPRGAVVTFLYRYYKENE